MSSLKNLYIIIFKKFNNKLDTKTLTKKINDPRQSHKKTRLLKDSSMKDTLIEIKSEPKKEHEVISKTKCAVHNIHIGKNTSKSKMVFKKKMQFDLVPFLDNPFMWLKGLYKNIYIDDDERLGTKYKVMPSICTLPSVTNKNKFCVVHKSTKVFASQNDKPVFIVKKSFPPSTKNLLEQSSTDSSSVKNISVVTKDISCSTLDERSILATCLCVLPLAHSKIANDDIKEQQTNDKLKTIENNDNKQQDNLNFPDDFQSLKTYPSEINKLLSSKTRDSVPVTVLHVNVEDFKSQMNDPESSKDQAMTKIFSLKNESKIKLRPLLELSCMGKDLQTKKATGNKNCTTTVQKPDCIEHIIRNYKVNSFSTLGECDLSSFNNSGGRKKFSKKVACKDKQPVNKLKLDKKPEVSPIRNNDKPVPSKQIKALKIDTFQTKQQPQEKKSQEQNLKQSKQSQEQLSQQLQHQQSQQLHQQLQQQQQLQLQQLQQQQLQQQQLQQGEQMYYYWPMQIYNEAISCTNVDNQEKETPTQVLNSVNVVQQAPDAKINNPEAPSKNISCKSKTETNSWQSYKNSQNETVKPTVQQEKNSDTIKTPAKNVSDKHLSNSKAVKKDTPWKNTPFVSKNNITQDLNEKNMQAQTYISMWPVNCIEAYNNLFAQQQNPMYSMYTIQQEISDSNMQMLQQQQYQLQQQQQYLQQQQQQYQQYQQQQQQYEQQQQQYKQQQQQIQLEQKQQQIQQEQKQQQIQQLQQQQEQEPKPQQIDNMKQCSIMAPKIPVKMCIPRPNAILNPLKKPAEKMAETVSKNETPPKKPTKPTKKSTKEKITNTLIQLLNTNSLKSNKGNTDNATDADQKQKSNQPETGASGDTLTQPLSNLPPAQHSKESPVEKSIKKIVPESTVVTEENYNQPIILAASAIPLTYVQLSNPNEMQQNFAQMYNTNGWEEVYRQLYSRENFENNNQLQAVEQEESQLQFSQLEHEAAIAAWVAAYNQQISDQMSQQTQWFMTPETHWHLNQLSNDSMAQETHWYMAQQSPEHLIYPLIEQEPQENTKETSEQKQIPKQLPKQVHNQTVNIQQTLDKGIVTQPIVNQTTVKEKVLLEQISNLPVVNTQQTVEQKVFSQEISNQPIVKTQQILEENINPQEMSSLPVNTQQILQQKILPQETFNQPVNIQPIVLEKIIPQENSIPPVNAQPILEQKLSPQKISNLPANNTQQILEQKLLFQGICNQPVNNVQQSQEQKLLSKEISNQPVNNQQFPEQKISPKQISNQPKNIQQYQSMHMQENTQQMFTFPQEYFYQQVYPQNNTQQASEQTVFMQNMSYEPFIQKTSDQVTPKEKFTNQVIQAVNRETMVQQNVAWPENYAQSFHTVAHQEEQPENAMNLANHKNQQKTGARSEYEELLATAVREKQNVDLYNVAKPKSEDISIKSKTSNKVVKVPPVNNKTNIYKTEKNKIKAPNSGKNSHKYVNSIMEKPRMKMRSLTENKIEHQSNFSGVKKNQATLNDSITQQIRPWPLRDSTVNSTKSLNKVTSNSENILPLKNWQQNTNQTKTQDKLQESLHHKKNVGIKSENMNNPSDDNWQQLSTPNFQGLPVSNWQSFVKNPLETKQDPPAKQEITSIKKDNTSSKEENVPSWSQIYETTLPEAFSKIDFSTKTETKSNPTVQSVISQSPFTGLTEKSAEVLQKFPEISVKSNQKEISNSTSMQNQQQIFTQWPQQIFNTSAKWNDQQDQQNNNSKTEQSQYLNENWQNNTYAMGTSPPWQMQNVNYPNIQQQSFVNIQEYAQDYNPSIEQNYYNHQANMWQQLPHQQYQTINEAIAQQKLTPVQSENELRQNYKLLDSYSMLDTKTDLYRIKGVKSKMSDACKIIESNNPSKYRSGLIDKMEKHYFCWKEHFFDKLKILQNSKNINIVKQFENTLQQIKNIDYAALSTEHPEIFVTLPIKDQMQNTVINANHISDQLIEVSDKNDNSKTIMKEEDTKFDDLALLSKIDAFVDVKPKINSEKAMIKTNDSFLLSKQIKDFPNIAKRKLHIQNVENVDLEEICKHSSLLLNCRIVLDGSERNEPNTTLHAKIYDYNEK